MKALLKGTKEKLDKEQVNMIEKGETEVPQTLPPKLEGPGKFTINVMPLSKVKELKLGEIIPRNITLTLADSYVIHPHGILQDVLVNVDGLVFPVDFMVIDMKGDTRGSFIHGCPFLATGKALIDVQTSELSLKFNKENMVFNVYE